MPTYFQRPENALKRANEFIDVGKKQRALDALYDVIKSKRHRTWQKIHEPIMNKYLELCVELKKSHVAKEGLFQYRNICQQINIRSLEDVVRGYLTLAEEKTEAAREESQQAVIDIDDLDNLQTPESLLLSAVSGEDAQDRTDRVVLTPWVKFLWESYRQCLELLRNNSRVERLYHDIAQQAFKFCLKYSRKTEFRKLCDNLRTHLGHIHKHQNQQTSVNLNNPESQQMHLETRLCQLDSAIQMELWQEAYKAIEDIHNLMTLPKKSPKPQLLANYYQKLALVFWKAGNYLFHASALFRLFTLCREQKKTLTQEEIQKMASRVVLATLAIPIPPPRNEIDRSVEADETLLEKQRRLATLLGLPNPPNRQSLIRDLARFNILPHVPSQLYDLYQWLEVEFHPLWLCIGVQKCFDFIQQSEELSELQQYIPALQDNTLVRLLKQVAQVYQTIQFSRLKELAPFADMFHLERIIVDSGRYGDLQVSIDHRTRTLYFGTGPYASQREEAPEGPQLQSMPSERIRQQLIQMSCTLHKSVSMIQSNKKQQEREQLRQSIVAAYAQHAKDEHIRILGRRLIIEDRKEMLENLNIQREEEERRQLEEQRKKQVLLEEERLLREAEEREKQRKLQEHQELTKKCVKDRIKQLKDSGIGAKIFLDIDEEALEKLNADEIMQRQMEQLDRERRDLQAKLKSQEKKVDHMARAKRLEEIPMLQKACEDKKIRDREFWEQQEQERIKQVSEERQLALQHRDRMVRMVADKNKFLEQLMAARTSVYKERLVEFEKDLEKERKKRLEERREQYKIERREKWLKEKEEEAIRKKIEEEERLEAERQAEEERKKAAEEAAYREREAKLNAIEAKKRAREQELEEKYRNQEAAAAAAATEKQHPTEAEKPRSNAETSWRKGPRDDKPREKDTRDEKPSWRSMPKEDWRRDKAPDSDKLDGERDEHDGVQKEKPVWRSRRFEDDKRRDREDDRPSRKFDEGDWRRMKDDRRPDEGSSWRSNRPRDTDEDHPTKDSRAMERDRREPQMRDDDRRRRDDRDDHGDDVRGRDRGPQRRDEREKEERGGGAWKQDDRDKDRQRDNRERGAGGGRRWETRPSGNEERSWRSQASDRDKYPADRQEPPKRAGGRDEPSSWRGDKGITREEPNAWRGGDKGGARVEKPEQRERRAMKPDDDGWTEVRH